MTSSPLDVIHSDVWGPIKHASMLGSRFYVTFVDDHTRKVWVYFMKSTGEVFENFTHFKIVVEKETCMLIKCLHLDGGGEYFSNEFSRFLAEQGVKRQFTCRYAPKKNRVAKRKHRNIAKIAHALMSEKNMPKHFWAEVVHRAVYVMNRTPTTGIHDMTLEERYTGVKSDVSHLKVFGCIAYAHIPDELRKKLDPKTEKCIFIGYSLTLLHVKSG